MNRPFFALLIFQLGALFSTTPAAAFVRSVTADGCHPVYWAQTCIYVTPDSAGVPDMTLADVERVSQEALASWQTRIIGSSFLTLQYLPATIPRETIATDGLQIIKFRATTWCRPALDSSSKEVCYDASAAALTTVTYVNKPMDATLDGKIVDADIELNAVNNFFYDADTQPNPQAGARKAADLWNTLTHEMGHMMGLEHTCRRGSFDSMPACTIDNTGGPVIQCSKVELGRTTDPTLEAIYETSMYPTADPKETRKRIPKADDVSAIINTYPTFSDPRVCKVPDAGQTHGCSAAGLPGGPLGGAGGFLSALALIWLFVLLRRSRTPTA